jgi:hypothetical protein
MDEKYEVNCDCFCFWTKKFKPCLRITITIATMNRFSNADFSADNNRKTLCFTLEIQELLPKLAAKQPSHFTHTALPERMEV